MFTPFKFKSSRNYSVLNDTVLNTPQPQATSTVRRKSTLKYQFDDKLHSGEEKRKQDSPEKELTPKEDTLLGILDNMSDLIDISIAEDEQKLNCSSFDEDLESAKRLLQKCSDIKNSSLTIDTNKENNANMQNIAGTVPVSNFTFPIRAYTSELDKECMNHSTSEVTFDPNEITAQSSVSSSSAKRQSPVNKSFKSTSFNDNNVYEMMAEINNNEKFLSGSKMVQQLSIDEAFWKQSCTHCLSVNPEKQKVHCNSLSGFIGDIDLSIESCAGRKVSVDQYFERKSSEMKMLGNNEKVNFDAVSETPVRGKLPALVESTILTDATVSSSELEEKENIPASRDTDENSIISLSTIAKILQDANSETPRRLVDQLLMAQKKKEKNSKIRAARKGATMPSNEKSILTMPIGIFNNFDGNIDKTNSSTNISKKKILKEGACNENVLSPFVQDLGVSSSDFTFSLQNSVLSCSDKWTELSNVSLKMNRKSYDEESYNDLNIQSKEVIKERDISNSMISSSFSVKTNAEIQFESNKNIVFGENTEKLCNCIVGMTSEVNVELVNNGDRWITCIFKPTEIVGDTQSIELNISSESLLNNFLIKPNASQSTKIEVKVTKMCKPIFVVLNVFLLDMVTNSKWSMEHIIFVHPEQLELDIICPFDKQELDFQCIAEETTKVLPITFYNKNNVDVPVKLSILQVRYEFKDESKMFSINVPTHLVLKSHEKCIINVKCKKSQSTSIDSPRRQPQHWKSKLIICVQYKDDTILLRKEVPLYAQIGVCKIQIIDTEIPIVVSRQQGKLINIVNSGNVATQVSASIVPIEGHPNTQDFSIKPDNVFLQVGEQNSFLIVYKPQFSDANSVDNERYARIKLIAENNIYHYIISTKQSLLESEKENYFRCHTPNNIVSPAISPQSVTSDRSGPCDRNSPISMVSIAVAGDTFPIKSTHPVLVWGSVKTGKSETKKFTICNISNNKIKIQIDIHDVNKNFKFIGDKQTVNTSMILAMQRQEFKTLTVAFSPYCVGAVVGKITIKHYAKENNDSQQSKKIRLYGYGGFSKVKIGGTFKDASGKMWLSLGNLYSETTTLSANITLDNVGDLCSFAKITVIPKVIFSTINSSWYVNLKDVILNPKESQQITIQFHPKKEEFALLQRSEVSHVATINVTYGDEPTRWRIRRLYNKIKESGKLTKNENEILKNIVQPIYNAFPGEHFTPDLMSIHDSIQNLRDVCTGVHQSEIMLTVEACVDDTLPVHYDTDESKMYQTLSDTTYIDEANGNDRTRSSTF